MLSTTREAVAPIRRGAGSLQGFTLIELLIVIVVVAILASIALPTYRDYVVRSRLVDVVTGMLTLRSKMEQYYQDNRSYASVGSFVAPCLNPANRKFGAFTLTCTVDATSYLITATGSEQVAGFEYTIDQNGTQMTNALPPDWGNAPQTGCWVQRKGQTC